MILPEGHRATLVLLRVAWDPETQDHPMAWGWDTLLQTEVDVVEFHEPSDTFDVLLRPKEV